MSEKLLNHLFDAKPPRDRRDEVTATVVSVIVHILLVILLIGVTSKKVLTIAAEMGVGDGIGAGPAGGGGGGGSDDGPIVIAPVEQAPAPVQETPPEPIPEPIPVPQPAVPVELPPIALALPDSMPRITITPPTAGSGIGQGTGNGAGTGAGTGPGSGGGSGGGEGGGIGSGFGPGTGRGRLLAPSPEVLLIPPTAPGSVRGKTVVVRLAVDSAGVVRDADVIPSTGDRKYDAALKRVALGWRFRAARDPNNKPVAVFFDVTFTF